MAMPRKSLEAHRLSGTKPQYGDPDAPVFAAGKPRMPRDLPLVAQAEWKRITRELKKRGTLTCVDSSALEVYTRLFANWKSYCEELDKYGPMIEETVLDKDSKPHVRRVLNPAGKIAIQLGNAVRQYQKEFSATPASREKTRPAAPEAPKTPPPKTQEQLDEERFAAICGEEK